MTIVTKNGLSVKKMEIIRVPLGEDILADEDKVEVYRAQDWVEPKQASKAFVCISFISMIIVLALTTSLLLYRQYYKAPSSSNHRYQGYCTVTLPADFREDSPWIGPNFQVVPIVNSDEHEFQLVSTLNDKPTKELVNALREELDIEESVEKIGVFDNGHHVNFIHDFNTNLTSIVDSDRCFVMDLEPELVLGPAVFAAGLSRGEEFDVSRVRSALRAVLPALTDLASSRLASACVTRPSYRLTRDENVLIRKRSAEDPPHDYIHFSGKHIQEIKIENMQEILDYENQNKKV